MGQSVFSELLVNMLVEVAVVVVILGYIAYRIATKNFDHWEKAGIPYMPPYPFVGNTAAMILPVDNPLGMLIKIYNYFPDKRFYGTFLFRQPLLLIRDPELVKQVMIKDFDHFINRNQFTDEKAEPVLGKSLSMLKDQPWRECRNTLSPTFTGSKMKTTFQLIDVIGEQMSKYLSKKLQKEKDSNGVLHVECKDMFTRFTNDVIATSAFGIKVDSLQQPTNEFYMMGKLLTKFNAASLLATFVQTLVPKFALAIKLSVLSKKATAFFSSLVMDTVRQRDQNKIVRPDLLHLLMEARAVKNEKGEIVKPGFSDEELISQSVLFFFAGFETISTFLGFAAYELALNPEVQARLQEEIDRVMEEDGNKLTYDGVMTKMKYLDQVVSEVLRKWPPAPLLDRCVTKTYKLETRSDEPEVTLNVGDVVFIPAGAFHYDPQYFPNPQLFDPERFNEKNKKNINPITYMPFGMGPRNCIGMRFALMEAKVCLVHILKHLSFVPVSKTQIPLKLKSGMMLQPANGYILGLKAK